MQQLTTLASFKRFLTAHGIDYSRWGDGPTKDVDRLFYEYESGETEFIVRNRRLIRVVKRVQILIYYRTREGTLFFLVEKRQVFRNGGVRKRSRKRSLSEKMLPSEPSRQAALRACKEEIGITGLDRSAFKKLRSSRKGRPEDSDSYPGLPSVHYGPRFRLMMPGRFYERRGYDEVQQDKTTEFRWARTKTLRK